ncbi:MAG: PhoX family phosphatase [Acidiferrobacterales bacterium]|nr:PhoX family phosphatase [Acidiferrobacterales bacterium]
MKNFDNDDIAANPNVINDTVALSSLVEKRLSRRLFLAGLGSVGIGTTGLSGCSGTQNTVTTLDLEADDSPQFTFAEISRGSDGLHHVPEGYEADVLIRWGDPLFQDAPNFNPTQQSAETQVQQFGYNNDFIGFIPIDDDHAILFVNHESSSTKDMFPKEQRIEGSATRIKTEMASQGNSIIALRRSNGRWSVDKTSPHTRRITANTEMHISGPAAGHARMKTSADPSGLRVLGTLGNCAGGITPWGTYLTAEENIDDFFSGRLDPNDAEAKNHERMGVPLDELDWHKFDPRFDVAKNTHEPNRFGWIVEIDPKKKNSIPKKRTALGRFKHEGAETVLAPDGRVVIYMGDDQRGDYLYKFVTRDAYNADKPNPDLLDQGTLYVAQFSETEVQWLPLTYGQGPLTNENGFYSQADILIDTRLAADALGATSMDRPEDVQPNAHNGKVYVMLTKNKNRSDAIDAPLRTALNVANPRAKNIFGHIIEITEPDGDFAATTSRWDFLVKCGDPNDPSFGAVWNPLTSNDGWFSAPDNCAIDPTGGVWVAPDGNPESGAADGLWAMETTGERRGTGRAFFRAPVGAEVCGPRFSNDGTTLFLSVQKPGESDDTNYETPLCRWPDNQVDIPPRPSVVAIYRKDGKTIGV